MSGPTGIYHLSKVSLESYEGIIHCLYDIQIFGILPGYNYCHILHFWLRSPNNN